MDLSDLNRIVHIPVDAAKVERKAMIYAYKMHSEVNQKRKYSGKHYIVHPAAVADIVRNVQHTPQMLAAAWLHDTVEDTHATLDQIKTRFGKEVYLLVEMLTDSSKPEDGNRKRRKEIDRQHLAKANPGAKTIKLADLIHNSQSITKNDPGFAKVYMQEMSDLLEVLKEGDSELWNRAYRIAYKS